MYTEINQLSAGIRRGIWGAMEKRGEWKKGEVGEWERASFCSWEGVR